MNQAGHQKNLENKLASGELSLCVIGLGYVGLPLSLAFAQEGLNVTGVDVDAAKVASITAGESYVADVPADELHAAVSAGKMSATTDFGALAGADAIVICVPTPLSKTHDPNISYIIAAADQIAAHFHPGQLIVLESTTYPGTTEEIILPRIACDGYEPGVDFFLAFSPERIDPGNKTYGVRNTPKVIGGMTPACLEMAMALYSRIVQKVVPVSSTQTAEMVKLLENTFRAVNIGLINEVALMCDKLGISVWEVIEAASTKPYGFMPFYPGPGLGGHCIPLDPYYLAWKLKTLDYNARFIQLAGEVNSSMPHHVVSLISTALNERREPVRGSNILILGVAYKPNVADVRESPAIDILQSLHAQGAVLHYHDPYIPQLDLESFELAAVDITDALLESTDCVVIVTPHAAYDWEFIVRHSRLVVDTRNATGKLPGAHPNVVKL